MTARVVFDGPTGEIPVRIASDWELPFLQCRPPGSMSLLRSSVCDDLRDVSPMIQRLLDRGGKPEHFCLVLRQQDVTRGLEGGQLRLTRSHPPVVREPAVSRSSAVFLPITEQMITEISDVEPASNPDPTAQLKALVAELCGRLDGLTRVLVSERKRYEAARRPRPVLVQVDDMSGDDL